MFDSRKLNWASKYFFNSFLTKDPLLFYHKVNEICLNGLLSLNYKKGNVLLCTSNVIVNYKSKSLYFEIKFIFIYFIMT